MVRSHSALTYAAKWHGTGCQMNYGIVDAAATETAGAKKLFLCGALNASKATSPEEQAASLFSAGSWPWAGWAHLQC